MCALPCVLFAMTTSNNVVSVTGIRDVGPLLPKSWALQSAKALQLGDSWDPPPIDDFAFQGSWAMGPLAWTQLYDD
eukprot:10885181-Alexandrium_andersonii.AAC.1